MLTVVSHRRSGTHLTIDLIRNNFKQFSKPYVSLDDLNKRDKLNFKKFRLRANSTKRIFKSHTDVNYQLFYNYGNSFEMWNDFSSDSKIIYVYRNVFDCITSLYFHYQSYSPKKVIGKSVLSFFEEKNDYHNHNKMDNSTRYNYWADHITGWENMDSEILFISFEDIIKNYDYTIKRIAKFLHLEISSIYDVRLNNDDDINIVRNNKIPIIGEAINYTTVNFRKGKIGDCMTYFNSELISKFKERILNKYGTSKLLERSFSTLDY